ncbi:DUF4389 domain-containing protein [Methylocaldum marinum]|uniref:DUF4389 domain-containing protein n=1 Tax=Methylocaldum marinum TaxID=1432792 RepID=UPI000E69DC7E
MKDPIDNNQVSMNAFKRLLFMALFFALFGIVRFILWAIVLFQFIAHLFTGRATYLGVKRRGQAFVVYFRFQHAPTIPPRIPRRFAIPGARQTE